jgi:ribosomal protein S12 methylthiotransferase
VGKQNVKIVTLGCAKNEVDSEEIAGTLVEAGFAVDGSKRTSDVTVINTCGFLESAKEESIAAIQEALAEKQRGNTGKVIVAGCLAQRMGKDLQTLLPDVDLFVGVGQMGRFDQLVEEVLASQEPKIELRPPQHLWANVRARTGAPWTAYLKLSEGCDHRCTFCTIPSFRGRHQSKPIERLVSEARTLATGGAKELNLIAQDVTQYGYDLYGEFTLPKLLRELNKVEGVDWIRLLYFYPNRLTDEVIEAMAELPKVLEYIDIPLQHSSGSVLRRMKRPWDGERYLKLFDKVRAAIPNVAIRTTFIVGFPQESEEEFEDLLDFVEAARFDRVGAFLYSPEPGTPAGEMDGQVPFAIKKERYAQLMELQQGISTEKNEAWVGESLSVLTECKRGKFNIGRSFRDAPEIDGFVFFSGLARPGRFARVKVQRAEPYDLFGSC